MGLSFCHTYREANSWSDWLANQSLQKEFGYKEILTPHADLDSLLLSDVSRASLPPLVACWLFLSLGFKPLLLPKKKI